MGAGRWRRTRALGPGRRARALRAPAPFVRGASAPPPPHGSGSLPVLSRSRGPLRGKQPGESGSRRANLGAGLGVRNVRRGTSHSAPQGQLTPRPPSILAGGFINVCFLSVKEFNAECPAPSGSAGCARCSKRPSPNGCGPPGARPARTRASKLHPLCLLPSLRLRLPPELGGHLGDIGSWTRWVCPGQGACV